MTKDVWTYRERTTLGADPMSMQIVGYEVEALDGSIGKIDEASHEAGSGYLVVDTGPWIFGKKVMLPAGIVREVDDADERVFVNRTKDEIKSAPEFDETTARDETYRRDLGSYYGSGGAGYRGWDDTV
jgi:hypothetical protein